MFTATLQRYRESMEGAFVYLRTINIAFFLAGGALIVILIGIVAAPFMFRDRVLPGIQLGQLLLSGIPMTEITEVLNQYDTTLREQVVSIEVRGTQSRRALADFGVSLNIPATEQAVRQHRWRELIQGNRVITPIIAINTKQLQRTIEQDFAPVLKLPRNASLRLASGNVVVVKGATGEGIDFSALEQDITERATAQQWDTPVNLRIAVAEPIIQDNEAEAARRAAQKLLVEGITLAFEDKQWKMQPFTVRRLLSFPEIPDPSDPANQLIGVALDGQGLQQYLTNTIAPEIDYPAENARFELADSQLTQLAEAKSGKLLALAESAKRINEAVTAGNATVELAVIAPEPAIATLEAAQGLNVTTLLARGESDFAGSPRNRIHNITVGAARYHGILIPPGSEFSFNQFLGPVTAEAGFKPELVIKKNVTIPELGGGLCQVSTTAFRAAVQSGLPITARRNHAYAVSYYGTPGYDATIYPPYTDLKFTNDTPGYILVQTRVEGTKLAFEFWGQSDGRETEVIGPTPYDRKPDGSVKATLTQKVMKDGQVMREDSFESRYRSASLFPKTYEYVATPKPNGIKP